MNKYQDENLQKRPASICTAYPYHSREAVPPEHVPWYAGSSRKQQTSWVFLNAPVVVVVVE